MKNIEIYTDGACSGNPGMGGYGAVLIYQNRKKEISGFEKETTNNRMELTAVIEALKLVKEPCNIKIYSDSAYVCNAFINNWIISWQNNNFKTSTGKSVKNVELWTLLIELLSKHKFQFIKVKGHADNKFNNRCDELATSAIKDNR